MGLKDLHRWDVTYREAVAIPEDLRKKLLLRNAGIADPVRGYLTTGKGAEAIMLLVSYRLKKTSPIQPSASLLVYWELMWNCIPCVTVSTPLRSRKSFRKSS